MEPNDVPSSVVSKIDIKIHLSLYLSKHPFIYLSPQSLYTLLAQNMEGFLIASAQICLSINFYATNWFVCLCVCMRAFRQICWCEHHHLNAQCLWHQKQNFLNLPCQNNKWLFIYLLSDTNNHTIEPPPCLIVVLVGKWHLNHFLSRFGC